MNKSILKLLAAVLLFVPAARAVTVHSERTSPTVVEQAYETDVCVVGGGMAGICAAVASARNGARTMLVQDRPVLGGNASSEIRVPVSGAYGDVVTRDGRKTVIENREGGLIEEIKLENVYRNPTANWQVWDHVLWNFCTREKNLKVLLNTAVQDCRTDGGRIVSVFGWDSLAYARVTVRAKIFIDCTGDGILRLSGAEYMKGREAKSEFNEPGAPEKASETYMGSTLMVFAEPTGLTNECARAPETTKPYPVSAEPLTKGKKIVWTCSQLEYGGETNTLAAASWIRDELFRYSYGYWEKQKGTLADGRDANGRFWERTFVSSIPGKRESIRYVGDHILTANDLLAEGRAFTDNIGHGGWPMDDHFSAGFFFGKQTVFNKCPTVYGIPYRSLYSRNVPNLMFAGRDVSVTHMALSSTRVQATCAVMGQAAGTAAALAVRHATDPRGVYTAHLAELQDTLQWQDQFIPWRPRKITALSRAGALSHEVLRDGMDRLRLDGEHCAELKPGEATVYSFEETKTFKGVRLVVDTNLYDNRWHTWWITERKAHAFPAVMPRDFDVQVETTEGWKTVASVRDNCKRWLDLAFDRPVDGRACRVVWKRSWADGAAPRVFSYEVY